MSDLHEIIKNFKRPKTEAELYSFMYLISRENIPHTRVCPDHSSPWDFITAAFFNKYRNILGIGNRKGGKTKSVAKLIVAEIAFHPFIEVASIGAIEKQAQKCYSYCSNFLSYAMPQMIEKNIRSETRLTNGSLYSQLIATMSGVNCLVGDTLIDCPRDLKKYPKGIPIRELVGQEFYTYSYDIENDRFLLKPASEVCMTGEKVPVYKVTYEWIKRGTGEKFTDTIIGTSHHPILLKNGEYKAIGELLKGDRIQPFFSGISLRDSLRTTRRQPERWIRTDKNEYIAEHILVYTALNGEYDSSTHHIHHKNHNHLDNRPENLELITKEEHCKHHFGDDYQKFITALTIKKMAKSKSKYGVEPLWHSKEWLEAELAKGISIKELQRIYKTTAIHKWAVIHGLISEPQKKLLEQNKAKTARKQKALLDRQLGNVPRRSIYANPPYRDRDILYKELSKGLRVDEVASNLGTERSVIYKYMKRFGFTEFYQQKQTESVNENHTVVSVEFYGYEDVYDMRVEDTHNFIANGIVVHNSPHPSKLRADEVELMRSEVLDDLFLVPVSDTARGYPSNTLLTSTRKYHSGLVQSILENDDSDFKPFIWCYKEVSQPCPLERRGSEKVPHVIKDFLKMDTSGKPEETEIIAYSNCGSCPLLPSCRGDLARSRGYLPIDDFISDFKKVDISTWIYQMECRRTFGTYKVYPQFDEVTHVIRDLAFNPNLPLDIVVDFGYSDPTCVLFIQYDEDKDTIYVVDEIYEAGMTTEQLHMKIRHKLTELGLRQTDVRYMLGDSAQAQQIADLNAAYGYNFEPVKKMVIVSGLDKVRQYFFSLESGIRLYYGNNVPNLTRETKNYHFKKLATGMSENPVDRDNHCLDCYSSDTEVLTENGWQVIKDVDIQTTKVASLTPEGEVVYAWPSERIVTPYEGDMIAFSTRLTGGKDYLMVTPNHKMLVQKQGKTSPEFILADNLSPFDKVVINSKGQKVEQYEPILVGDELCKSEPFFSFLGWFLAEGSCLNHLNKQGNPMWEVCIAQKNEAGIQKIEDVLKQLPFHYQRRKDVGFIIQKKALWELLKPIGDTYTKRFPREFINAPPKLLLLAWESYVDGDGWRTKGRGTTQCASVSEKLIDDWQEVLIRCGKNLTICKKDLEKIKGGVIGGRRVAATKDQFWGLEIKRKFQYIRTSSNSPLWRKVSYKGEVVCLTVNPYHTLCVRRPEVKRAVWCGNSLRYYVVFTCDQKIGDLKVLG